MSEPTLTVVWDGTDLRPYGKYLAGPTHDARATIVAQLPTPRVQPESIADRVRLQLQSGDKSIVDLAVALAVPEAKVEHALHYLVNRTNAVVRVSESQRRYFGRGRSDVRYGLRKRP